MAISKNPMKKNQVTLEENAEAFISGAASTTEAEQEQNKKPIMVRIAPALLARIDNASKRLGISRSAFIVSSTAERLEKME
jgi:predicted HicB family RNase H-like nuclease